MGRDQTAHCSLDGDWSSSSPRLRFADGGRLLKLSFARSPAAEWNAEMFPGEIGRRGKCKGFSFGSRRRMLDRLNSVSVASSLPQFITMTLPDDVFCDDVGEFARTAKHWLDTFEKRLLRVAPKAAGFWRIEWKARASGIYLGKLFPHFHLLVWGLPEREVQAEHWWTDKCGVDRLVPATYEAFVECDDQQLSLELLDLWSEASKDKSEWRFKIESVGTGRVFAGSRRFTEKASELESVCLAAELGEGVADLWVDRARKMSFQDWASLAWYHVVDSHNLDHLQAGVRVERVRTWGGVMSYCSKYMAKADAEFMADIAWGRSWGIFNRKFVPWARMVYIDLNDDVGVRLRRIARRYLEHRFGRRVRVAYGITVYCDTSQFRRLWEHSPPDTPF